MFVPVLCLVAEELAEETRMNHLSSHSYPTIDEIHQDGTGEAVTRHHRAMRDGRGRVSERLSDKVAEPRLTNRSRITPNTSLLPSSPTIHHLKPFINVSPREERHLFSSWFSLEHLSARLENLWGGSLPWAVDQLQTFTGRKQKINAAILHGYQRNVLDSPFCPETIHQSLEF